MDLINIVKHPRFVFKRIAVAFLVAGSVTVCLSCNGKSPSSEKNTLNTMQTTGTSSPEQMESLQTEATGNQQAGLTVKSDKVTADNNKNLKTEGIGKSNSKPTSNPSVNTMVYGITIGFMDLAFKLEGKNVTLRPEAEKALTQIKKDGFTYIHMMEPFVKGYMKDFPALSVHAIKLLKEKGFKVLLTINGSPFINGDTDSEDKWVYRYFPGTDKKGTDDDGGLKEHKLRLTKFMDLLKREGLLEGLQFQLFDEPNSKKSFWGSYAEFEKLLEANIEVLTRPEYGIPKSDILFCAFTSKLMLLGDKSPENQLPYWNLAKSYKSNPIYNQFPFSFNWYPASGNPEKDKSYSSSDIKLKPIPEGSWITGMNVTAYMTKNNLLGKGATPGFRGKNTFREKLEDIDAFGKTHHFSGIYIFNLITRTDTSNEKGRISTGLFNSNGCPRYEYKTLLEFLNRPVNFDLCPVPAKSEF